MKEIIIGTTSQGEKINLSDWKLEKTDIIGKAIDGGVYKLLEVEHKEVTDGFYNKIVDIVNITPLFKSDNFIEKLGYHKEDLKNGYVLYTSNYNSFLKIDNFRVSMSGMFDKMILKAIIRELDGNI